MAYTYSKIATYTVGSGGISSVAFLNIAQNYTDLIIKISSRTSSAGDWTDTSIRFNSSSSGYSGKLLFGIGSSAYSQSESASAVVYRSNRESTTSNTFDNTELYIPNYTSSKYKTVSIENLVENNSASSNLVALGSNLWSNTEPITSITFTPSTLTFLQHSSFHLYGIKAEL